MLRPRVSNVTRAATALVFGAVLSVAACNDADRSERRQSGTAASREESGANGNAGATAHASNGGRSGVGGAAPARNSPASTQAATFTGTLRGSAVAIGGETTGWRLEGDNETGGIDVDVSRVTGRARTLDGKRVSVAGKMTTRSWPERGETQVLVVDRIDEAPAPAPGAGRTPATR